jgi:HAD superfamily hydrolase (TIGR01549 family)
VVTLALPRVLLFDLDDTILHFSAGQPNFWRLALERQLPDRSDHGPLLRALESVSHEFWADEKRAFWGRQNMFEARRGIALRALGAASVPAVLCERVADEMTEQKEAHVRPFQGALEVLRRLQASGHRLGLLTNGCARFQRRKLARFELEGLFELILIEGELGYGKPDARVFAAALAHFGVFGGDVWMIGDNLDADIAGAQALGISGVWHDAQGAGLPEGCTCVPDRVIRSITELLPV